MKNQKEKKLQKTLQKEAESAMYIINGSDLHAEPKTVSMKRLHPSVLEDSHLNPLHEGHNAAFSWIAPEYIQHPKSVAWWVWAGVVFLVSAILEFITGNYTMLIATVTFAVVYSYIHHYHPPRHTKVSISDRGIKIGYKMFPYADIATFWVFYDSHRIKTLNIRLYQGLFPDLSIELEDQDPVKIREYLLEHLPEWEGKKEHFSDIILRLVKL